MRKFVVSAFVVGVLAAISSGVSFARVEDEIEQLEQKRSDAIAAADMATLDTLYADEFYYNRAGGDSLTKSQYFALLSSGEVKVRRAVREGVKIRVYGETAVVTGMQHIDVTLKGEDRTVHLRYLHVWVKKGYGWKLVARQATNLPAQN